MAIDLKSQVVHAATTLGLSELLDGGSVLDEIAARARVHPDGLRRLIQGMVHFGLCVQHDGLTFELTPAGWRLLRDEAALRGAAGSKTAPGMLLYSVRSGKPAFEHAFGMPFFEYTRSNPAAARRFGALMAVDTQQRAADIAASYDFARAASIVDVGGGHGELIVEILKRRPQIMGTLFDIEPVVFQAQAHIEAEDLAPRCRVVAGDFFERLPAGSDLYLYAQVLHDWDDERCRAILCVCRQALAPGGRVLVVEMPLPERIVEGTSAVELDLMMLMLTGGRERTIAEYRDLLASAGFGLARVIPTGLGFALLEAGILAETAERG